MTLRSALIMREPLSFAEYPLPDTVFKSAYFDELSTQSAVSNSAMAGIVKDDDPCSICDHMQLSWTNTIF